MKIKRYVSSHNVPWPKSVPQVLCLKLFRVVGMGVPHKFQLPKGCIEDKEHQDSPGEEHLWGIWLYMCIHGGCAKNHSGKYIRYNKAAYLIMYPGRVVPDFDHPPFECCPDMTAPPDMLHSYPSYEEYASAVKVCSNRFVSAIC